MNILLVKCDTHMMFGDQCSISDDHNCIVGCNYKFEIVFCLYLGNQKYLFELFAEERSPNFLTGDIHIYSQTRCSFDGNSAMLWRNVPILMGSLLDTTCNIQFKFARASCKVPVFIFPV